MDSASYLEARGTWKPPPGGELKWRVAHVPAGGSVEP